MKNIEELNATIEELEKRIKAISSAGATLAQIIAVRDSLEQVKVCLNNLTTAIKDEEDDASVAQLTALEQRVTTAETDITTLQTDLTSTQDDLETVWNNLASTNSVVGEHTTTLTNLQTAQTNLQTTQTNQASTITTNTTDISNLKTRMTTAENTNTTQTNNINSLTTRMTTAENNISALTGGIDVGNLENRITEVEERTEPIFTNGYIHKHIEYNGVQITLQNFYSFPIWFCCTMKDEIRVKCKLTYSFSSESTLDTVLSLKNKANVIASTELEFVDNNKKEYEFDITFKPIDKFQELYFNVKYAHTMKIISVDYEIFGGELKQYNRFNDLTAICFNNQRYITYKKDNKYYYGKYSLTDTIDLDNMPNSIDINNTENTEKIDAFIYTPVFYIVGDAEPPTDYVDGRLQISTKVNTLNAFSPPEDNQNKYIKYFTKTTIGQPSLCQFYKTSATVKDGLASIAVLTNDNQFISANKTTNMTKNCLYTFNVSNNYINLSANTLYAIDTKILALFEDGYIYYLNKINLDYATKIAKGEYATAYIQQDGTVNVYITRENTVNKYVLNPINTSTFTPTYVKKYDNCDIVYEIMNNQIIKHTPSGWCIVTETN